jgi:hypothetical protein
MLCDNISIESLLHSAKSAYAATNDVHPSTVQYVSLQTLACCGLVKLDCGAAAFALN